jgi:hypothetical protein
MGAWCLGLLTRKGELSSDRSGAELLSARGRIARVPWEWWEGKKQPSERRQRQRGAAWREEEIDRTRAFAPRSPWRAHGMQLEMTTDEGCCGVVT